MVIVQDYGKKLIFINLDFYRLSHYCTPSLGAGNSPAYYYCRFLNTYLINDMLCLITTH